MKKVPLITIGASSGGPKALKEIMPLFPAHLPASILIVQHMPSGFTASLANRLNDMSAIIVREAREDDLLQPGCALLAPGGYHLEINKDYRIKLNRNPPKWGVRPCIDYMLNTAAEVYQEYVIGVILTGMGHDGAQGMKKVKENNGYVIVEDKSTALIYGMPASTIKAKACDEILPLQEIPARIMGLLKERFK
jgi:two-component system, chemotaxis family, protein-glutamate methylesterase/glutaminase